MGVYFGATEITGLYFGNTEIAGLYFGDTEIWAAWAEYDGTLPAQYTANGSTLADYRIYGAAGGVGDRTKQLFNAETAVYKSDVYKNDSGIEAMYPGAGYYETYIPITPSETIYVINTHGSQNLTVRLYFYDAQKQWVQRTDGYVKDFSVVAPSNAAYAQLQISPEFIPSPNTITITQSSTVEYVPYGYKLPMSVSDGTTSTTTPIYIGDEPLEADEYVDYQVGKVYRRTKNLVGIFESVEINGIKFKFDGALVYISGTASATIPANNQIFMALGFMLKAGTYNIRDYRSQHQTGFGGWILYDQNFTRIVYSNTAFTLSEDTEVFFGFYVVEGSVLDFSIGFVIVPESEGAITEYIPYYDLQDPPVPLPALPTVDGTNIVDYAGQSAAPSRFYAKYKKG